MNFAFKEDKHIILNYAVICIIFEWDKLTQYRIVLYINNLDCVIYILKINANFDYTQTLTETLQFFTT